MNNSDITTTNRKSGSSVVLAILESVVVRPPLLDVVLPVVPVIELIIAVATNFGVRMLRTVVVMVVVADFVVLVTVEVSIIELVVTVVVMLLVVVVVVMAGVVVVLVLVVAVEVSAIIELVVTVVVMLSVVVVVVMADVVALVLVVAMKISFIMELVVVRVVVILLVVVVVAMADVVALVLVVATKISFVTELVVVRVVVALLMVIALLVTGVVVLLLVVAVEVLAIIAMALILVALHAASPSAHVYGSVEPIIPHCLRQDPPLPQQVGFPLILRPHWGHARGVLVTVKGFACVVVSFIVVTVPRSSDGEQVVVVMPAMQINASTVLLSCGDDFIDLVIYWWALSAWYSNNDEQQRRIINCLHFFFRNKPSWRQNPKHLLASTHQSKFHALRLYFRCNSKREINCTREGNNITKHVFGAINHFRIGQCV